MHIRRFHHMNAIVTRVNRLQGIVSVTVLLKKTTIRWKPIQGLEFLKIHQPPNVNANKEIDSFASPGDKVR